MTETTEDTTKKTPLPTEKLEWSLVESTNLHEVAYAPESQVLAVKYSEGAGCYIYTGVPTETWTAYGLAESKGKFVNGVVKPTYPCLFVGV